MLRLGYRAACFLLALCVPYALAQTTHGIPASVTSLSSSHAFNHPPGIPASVTSITPTRMGMFPSTRVVHHNGDHHHRPVFATYYPFYPYYYSPDTYDQSQPQSQPAAADEPAAPAPTIFENRSGGYHPAATPVDATGLYQRDRDQSAAGTNSANASNNAATDKNGEIEAEADQPATVLIFRDGHQMEVGNYVISGETLYNLSTAYRAFKIQIADLDIPATVKANEERGIEFKLPVKKNPA
jgi:hypothetical protein